MASNPEIPAWPGKPAAGILPGCHIGLPGEHSSAPIGIRNVRINPLD